MAAPRPRFPSILRKCRNCGCGLLRETRCWQKNTGSSSTGTAICWPTREKRTRIRSKPETEMVRRLSPHLKQLESESITIMREVAAEFHRPVLLYSVGKDSSVMLHIALKAFHPSK